VLAEKCDSANERSRSIQGQVSQEAYAHGISGAPLMQGQTTKDLPSQWQGVWEGNVLLNQGESLAGKTVAGDKSTHLAGEVVKLRLELGKSDSGSNIHNLFVQQFAGGADENKTADPDIIFWHRGDKEHLLICPGAHAYVEGDPANKKGGVSIGGTTLIGNNVHIGGVKPNGTVERSGASDQVTQDKEQVPGNTIVYGGNKDGILFGQPTHFVDQYFMADDKLRTKDGVTITAGRVDIDAGTMYPNGATIDICGSHDSGYLIRQLAGARYDVGTLTDVTNDRSTSNSNRKLILQLLGEEKQTVDSQTVSIAPGVYDQKTVTYLIDQNGKSSGQEEVVARYTALQSGEMLVQMDIKNRGDKMDQQFRITGRLKREQTVSKN
jgi:hypothetical protein